jgi:hypothetical protein
MLHRFQAGNVRAYILFFIVMIFGLLAIGMPFALGWMHLGWPGS